MGGACSAYCLSPYRKGWSGGSCKRVEYATNASLVRFTRFELPNLIRVKTELAVPYQFKIVVCAKGKETNNPNEQVY